MIDFYFASEKSIGYIDHHFLFQNSLELVCSEKPTLCSTKTKQDTNWKTVLTKFWSRLLKMPTLRVCGLTIETLRNLFAHAKRFLKLKDFPEAINSTNFVYFLPDFQRNAKSKISPLASVVAVAGVFLLRILWYFLFMKANIVLNWKKGQKVYGLFWQKLWSPSFSNTSINTTKTLSKSWHSFRKKDCRILATLVPKLSTKRTTTMKKLSYSYSIRFQQSAWQSN